MAKASRLREKNRFHATADGSRFEMEGGIPLGKGFSLGDGGVDERGSALDLVNYENQILVNIVPVFILLVLCGIALGFISFAIREYSLSRNKHPYSPINSNSRESEWDAQEKRDKTHDIEVENEYMIPQSRVYSLTSEEIVILKLVDCPNNFSGFSQFHSPKSNEDNYDVYSHLRIIEDEISSSGLLDKGSSSIRNNCSPSKITYSYEQLMRARSTVTKSLSVLKFIPTSSLENYKQIDELIENCKTICFGNKEKSSSKRIYLFMIICLSKTPAIYFTSKFCDFIEKFINNYHFNRIYPNCSATLQNLLLELTNNLFLSHWDFKSQDTSVIEEKLQTWKIQLFVMERYKLFHTICNYITRTCPLRHRDLSDSYLLTLLHRTIRQTYCNELHKLLLIMGQYIDRIENAALKLEMYYSISHLLESHYQCCLENARTCNDDLKRIIQHGLFHKQDKRIRKCSQDMASTLYNLDRGVGTWLTEIDNGTKFVSCTGKEALETMQEAAKKQRPITPGSWKIHALN